VGAHLAAAAALRHHVLAARGLEPDAAAERDARQREGLPRAARPAVGVDHVATAALCHHVLAAVGDQSDTPAEERHLLLHRAPAVFIVETDGGVVPPVAHHAGVVARPVV